jgi:hypothetical protein
MTKVAELMGISLHTERPHESLPGVIVGELGGPLYELVRSVTEVLNDTGAILVSGGYLNLGGFVLEALQEGAKHTSQNDPSHAALEIVLERVSRSLEVGISKEPTRNVAGRESIPCLPGHDYSRGTA